MRAAFLDMGSKMYGDCIFLDLDGFTILIDGGHPGDFTVGAKIPAQLNALTGKNKTEVDLLVVTHSHDDHVGCLPRMVEAGVLTARFALVSDPANRWPDLGDSDAADLGDTGGRLLDVLGEELPEPSADRDGFAAALDAAADLKTRYREMLVALKAAGTKVVRYQTDPLKPITDLLKGRGVKILGPTKKHIEACSAALNGARDDVRRRIRDTVARDADAAASLAELYVRVLGDAGRDSTDTLDASDRSKGAINNLSIVLSVNLGTKKILLPGDMQFADPETDGLETEMRALLKKVALTRYAAVKLPHHTSYNGWNETLHGQTLKSPLLIHSGGVNDATHPERSVLAMLKANQAGHTFLRTDRNGLITLTPKTGGIAYATSKGAIDDFSPNRPSDVGEAEPEPGAVAAIKTSIAAKSGSSDMVRITAEIPQSAGKVVITVEIAPGVSKPVLGTIVASSAGLKKKSLSSGALPADFAARCAGLLFVTNEERLAGKLGEEAVGQLRGIVEGAGGGWLGTMPFPFSAGEIQGQIAAALGARVYRGVVLLGDYDVVAPARFDCLPADLRAKVSPEVDDPDNFVVWSDGPYGDGNADGLEDLPVSRVPDAGEPDFFWRCLARAYRPMEAGYMLRNVNRPFADQVHALLPKGAQRFESETTQSASVKAEQLSAAHVYLMLHGSDFDAARFWGEEEDGHLEAINCGVLPEALGGVVFAGCCWGALIGRDPAFRVVTDDPPPSRRIADSMALSCLARGAPAFVGCTGAHYSPLKKPYNYYGHPMHASFWAAIGRGLPPAAALFDARQAYWKNLPHPSPGDRPAFDELAIELKLYAQFTCLGFGW